MCSGKGVSKVNVLPVFYLCINIGSLSSIATTEMELHLDFWPAYLLCLCMFVIGVAVLIVSLPITLCNIFLSFSRTQKLTLNPF